MGSKCQGIARTQSPTNKNYAPELPTFGAIDGVSPTGVQWKGLVHGEPPYGSRYPLCQVSMLLHSRGREAMSPLGIIWQATVALQPGKHHRQLVPGLTAKDGLLPGF